MTRTVAVLLPNDRDAIVATAQRVIADGDLVRHAELAWIGRSTLPVRLGPPFHAATLVLRSGQMFVEAHVAGRRFRPLRVRFPSKPCDDDACQSWTMARDGDGRPRCTIHSIAWTHHERVT